VSGRRPAAPDGALRMRLVLSAGLLLVTTRAARKAGVGPAEAAAFRAVNRLPDRLLAPTWAVMQLGTLGAAPAAAAVAGVRGRPRLARRLLVAGSGTWALSKVVKWRVRRPRPAQLLPDAHRRGRDASGLGYLSGHAGVAAALGAAAFTCAGPAGRFAITTAVPAVGLARMYVGAHLPLDILGGLALGLTVDAAVAMAQGGRD
jgi:membrane-associated phospholipid phosphatase